MNKKKLVIAFILLACFCKAQQNLVPNGSFETFSTCPTSGLGEINKAAPWFQPNYPYAGAGGSSDFFNFCMGVNCNSLGQCPRTGGGLAGGAFFLDSNAVNLDKWREYFEVGLINTLLQDKKYCVRFFINKTNNSSASGFPIKQLQAVLTNDSLLYNDPNYGYIQNVTPMMEADSIITDTLNWVKVEKLYTAIGGEGFITIGNFSTGNQVNYLVVGNPNASNNTLGYYFLDDVSIYEQPDVYAGADTLINPSGSAQLGITGRPDIFYTWQPIVGLSNPNIANPIANPTVTTTYSLMVTDTNQLACNNVFYDTITVAVGFVDLKLIESNAEVIISPNPASESVVLDLILLSNKQIELHLIDNCGRKMFPKIMKMGSNYNIDLTLIESGVYFIQIIQDSQLVSQKKLAIIK